MAAVHRDGPLPRVRVARPVPAARGPARRRERRGGARHHDPGGRGVRHPRDGPPLQLVLDVRLHARGERDPGADAARVVRRRVLDRPAARRRAPPPRAVRRAERDGRRRRRPARRRLRRHPRHGGARGRPAHAGRGDRGREAGRRRARPPARRPHPDRRARAVPHQPGAPARRPLRHGPPGAPGDVRRGPRAAAVRGRAADHPGAGLAAQAGVRRRSSRSCSCCC